MVMSRLAQKTVIVLSIFALYGCSSNEDVFQGYVEGEYAYIASAISGTLTKKFVDRGDKVSAKQPLFILDPEPEISQLEKAKSELTQASQKLFDLQKGARSTVMDNIRAKLKQEQANLDFVGKTLKRYKALYRKASIDKASLDKAESQYQQSLQLVKAIEANLAEARLGARENLIAAQKAIVKAATATVRQAKWALLQKSVRAPGNAQVFDTLYEEGEFVAAGQPVTVLLASQKNKIIFFVPEIVVGRLKIGDKLIVDCDSCKNSHEAQINFIAPNAEFTPPVIFSQDSREKLVYRIEAKPSLIASKTVHPGQPVDVYIDGK